MRSTYLMLGVMLGLSLSCSGFRQTKADRAALAANTWHALTVDGHAAIPVEVGARPWLQFGRDSARVAGSTGCNRIAGPFTVNGSSLKFGPLAMTRMACVDSAVNAQESAFAAALNEVDEFAISADTLTLFSGGKPRLRFVR